MISRRHEQQDCCRKDWHFPAIGALLSWPEPDGGPGISPRGREASGSAAKSAAVLEQEIPVRSVPSDGQVGPQHQIIRFNPNDRRHFIGGSDARIIMGDDQESLIRLWREKRGEAEPQDLSDNLIVQLGTVTEVLNRAWYQRASGHTVKDIQKRVRHPVHKWMAATLDGTVEQTGAVFEAKFMLPWAFTEEAAADKHMAQLQHNMWVTASRSAVLSIITGGGKWVEIKVHADPLYQHLLLTAEKKFWRCVQSGDSPVLFNIETPRPRLEAVKVIDMSTSNQWAELAATYLRTREAHGEHETAKADLKKLMPEDAKEAAGHGIKAKRSKSGAISFDAQSAESSHAPVQ
jgi:predicted phage-related endonuclease